MAATSETLQRLYLELDHVVPAECKTKRILDLERRIDNQAKKITDDEMLLRKAMLLIHEAGRDRIDEDWAKRAGEFTHAYRESGVELPSTDG